MKKLRHIALIALVIIVQLFLVAQFTLRPVNLAKIPYRRAERAAALTTWIQDKTPENKAAFDQELRLASRHTAIQQFTFTGVVFVAILSFEALVIYLGRKHDDK
jgi:hypothetical protein